MPPRRDFFSILLGGGAIPLLQARSSDGELEIRGSEADFVHLRDRIETLLAPGANLRVEIPCEQDLDPTPYEHCHATLAVAPGVGPNRFLPCGHELLIVGSPAALRNLCANLPIGVERAESPVGYHHHYDANSFPEHVDSNSPDVVLSLR